MVNPLGGLVMKGNKSDTPKQENPPGEAVAASVGACNDAKVVSRRAFFKRAAVGAVALTGTAEIAKHVASTIPDHTPQMRYEKDIQAGDSAMSEWEYVVMSDQEKQEMVQTFLDNYKKTI